ncbi:hypothetical protein Vadar_004837 [Vaccinium darrowii]|uniref:Uncharacterized protein n=1 Tax=Vaccinium darrowii TaxID=229202 RepID=A0ACB7WXU3_9ERIC|nr:hypothetical protein Vadar_004837 [Vaccinium darrowii]
MAPSKTYDSLTEDFSYALLLLTIVALLVAIVATWVLSERKELQDQLNVSSSDSSGASIHFLEDADRRLIENLRNKGSFPILAVVETENEGEATVEAASDAINPYLHYFDRTPESYNAFCDRYRIPSDVQVKLVADSDTMPFEEGRLNLPLYAITEGGIQFPLDPFFRLVLATIDLTTFQLSGGMFRIIMGIIELRKRHSLIFDLPELFEIYSLSYNAASGRRFFFVRDKYDHLVHTLPDSDPFINDFAIVTGNFMFGRDEAAANTIWFTVSNTAPVIIPLLRKLAKKAKIDATFAIPYEQRNILLLLDYTSNYNSFLRKNPREGEGEPSRPRKR